MPALSFAWLLAWLGFGLRATAHDLDLRLLRLEAELPAEPARRED